MWLLKGRGEEGTEGGEKTRLETEENFDLVNVSIETTAIETV